MTAITRVFCITLLGLLVSGCDISAVAGSARGSFERSLSVSGPVDLSVSTGSGDIRVRPGPPGSVRVRGQISARDSWSGAQAEEKVRWLEANPPIVQSGNRIEIGRIEDRRYSQNVGITFEVEVPEDTRLKGSTGSGDLEADGIRGPVEASTGSGNITLARVRERLHASTGSGDIEIREARGGVDVSTGSGDIHATGVSGAFKAGTGSGDVRVVDGELAEFEAGTGSGDIEAGAVRGRMKASTGTGNVEISGHISDGWEVESGSGDVILGPGTDRSFDLDIRTDNGRIDVAPQLTTTELSNRKEIRGKVRGGGALLRARTGNGDIRVR